jgi:hypothetical protein
MVVGETADEFEAGGDVCASCRSAPPARTGGANEGAVASAIDAMAEHAIRHRRWSLESCKRVTH